MKKRRGFTLIELLAVIIILGIVALIATPIILNVVENAQKKAFERSAQGYYDAARYVYNDMILNNEEKETKFTFEEGIQKSDNPNYILKVQGETPKSGTVILNKNGQILVAIANDKWCATTTGDGVVDLSEDIDLCGYAPEECFEYTTVALSIGYQDALDEMTNQNLGFEGMDGVLTAIWKFNKENPTCKGIVIIPEEYEGQKVELIYDKAFYQNQNITGVVLPKEMKIISKTAFSGASNLKQVVMNEELRYIGDNSFQSTSLTEVTIPSKVAYLGKMAFNKTKLKKVIILSSLEQSKHFTRLQMPPFTSSPIEEVVFGPNLKAIPNYLFYNAQSLNKIEIPNTVVSIGASAFQGNNLTSVSIPSSVISIGTAAFNNNQLSDDQAFIYKRNSDGSEDKTTIVSYGGANRDNVIIPSNVTSIESSKSMTDGVFSYNKITHITLNNGLENIGDYAFTYNQLTSVAIPSSVTNISKKAFSNNQFPNAEAITILGDNPARFDELWTTIGFPAKNTD